MMNHPDPIMMNHPDTTVSSSVNDQYTSIACYDNPQTYEKMTEDSLRMHTSTMDHWRSDPTLVVVPLENDVLCGRGKTAYHHSGNQSLQQDMVRRLEDFQAAESRFEKSIIVRDCIQCVLNRGGRFLKKNSATGCWYPTGFNDARDKVSHALRNNAGRGFKQNEKSYLKTEKQQNITPKSTPSSNATTTTSSSTTNMTSATNVAPETTTTTTTVRKTTKTTTSPNAVSSSLSPTMQQITSSNDTWTTTTTTTIITTTRHQNGEETVERREIVKHESSSPESTVTGPNGSPSTIPVIADKTISADDVTSEEHQNSENPSLITYHQQSPKSIDDSNDPRDDSNNIASSSFAHRRPRRGMKQWAVGDPADECIPQPNDVLCGRGKKAYQHQGNQRLQLAIGMKTAAFKATSSRAEKSLMVHNLIQSVLDRGGRFLKKDLKNGTWYLAGFNDAREKISHAFRNSPHIRSDLCIAVSGLCSLGGGNNSGARRQQQLQQQQQQLQFQQQQQV